MRSLSIIINRVRTGLPISDAERKVLEKHISDIEKNRAIVAKRIMLFIIAIATLGIIALCVLNLR